MQSAPVTGCKWKDAALRAYASVRAYAARALKRMRATTLARAWETWVRRYRAMQLVLEHVGDISAKLRELHALGQEVGGLRLFKDAVQSTATWRGGGAVNRHGGGYTSFAEDVRHHERGLAALAAKARDQAALSYYGLGAE